MLSATVVVSFGAVIAISAYALLGNSLVDVYWPWYPYLAQPITWLSAASIAFWYAGLKLWRERISRWPAWFLTFLEVFGFVVAAFSLYEVLYGFMLWGATLGVAISQNPAIDPDTLFSKFPLATSFAFTTRGFTTLLVLSGYGVHYVRGLLKLTTGRLEPSSRGMTST